MQRFLLAMFVLLALVPFAEAASTRAITIHAGSEGSRLYFRPADIKVTQGDSVTLTLINDDASTPHDWALLEYEGRDVEVYVNGGQTKTLPAFTANTPGEHRIVCQVVGHKQQGMVGTFIVEKKALLPVPAVAASLLALGLVAFARRRAP